MRMDLVAPFAQTPSEPPTIDLGPILLLVAVVFIAYVIASHIREVLTVLFAAAMALMIFGVIYLDELFRSASAMTPSV